MAHALFVCLHNAGRSQMSQALFERAADGRHTAASAGTQPGERIHPQVVAAMRELDIDLTDRTPHALDHELAEKADVVVTMGCGDECPTSRASATSTGTSKTPPACRSTRSGQSATTSHAGSTSSYSSSTNQGDTRRAADYPFTTQTPVNSR
jgi:Low molecular weight phosphotyrosine protein phosphatase